MKVTAKHAKLLLLTLAFSVMGFLSGCANNEATDSNRPLVVVEPSADDELIVDPAITVQTIKDLPLADSATKDPTSADMTLREDQVQSLEEGDPVISEQDDADAQSLDQSERELVKLEASKAVEELCNAIGNKLGSVSTSDCHAQPLVHSGYSTSGMSLAYRDYIPRDNVEPLGKVLLMGGIHGDEFSSVSIIFKWMKILDQHHSGLFHWRIMPSVNPDGLLQRRSQRQNINGVDLNRNFPTSDWDENALQYWKDQTKSNVRRFPGPKAASELETQWVLDQIESFDPDVIISMHAPYHLVDYDGPPSGPENLGSLYLRKLGVYPGSLGNYVGVDMKKPIVTVELKSAGIMPSKREIDTMWSDLVDWLREQLGEK